MHGTEEEGHQCGWGIVPPRWSFGWTWTFTEKTRSLPTCYRWLKGGEVLALLDHHHLHLHLNLLHHHLLHQQCPLHRSRSKPLRINQKQPNLYLSSSIGSCCQINVLLFCKEYKRYSTKFMASIWEIQETSNFRGFLNVELGCSSIKCLTRGLGWKLPYLHITYLSSGHAATQTLTSK